jgi:hypothetical protein
MEGQLPHASLMAPSMCHDRGVTIGMGGGNAVISSSRTILHFYQVGHGSFHSVSLFHWRSALLSYSSLCTLLSNFIWPPGSVIPRERGKPKRGPSWYCYVARQRRLHELVWASSTSLIHRNKELKMPLMAYVEEEIPEKPIWFHQNPSSTRFRTPMIDPTPVLQQWTQQKHWRGLLAQSKRKFPGRTARLSLLCLLQTRDETRAHPDFSHQNTWSSFSR